MMSQIDVSTLKEIYDVIFYWILTEDFAVGRGGEKSFICHKSVINLRIPIGYCKTFPGLHVFAIKWRNYKCLFQIPFFPLLLFTGTHNALLFFAY